MVTYRRKDKEPPMSVEYVDVTILPNDELAQELAWMEAEDEGTMDEVTKEKYNVGIMMKETEEIPTKDILLNPDYTPIYALGDMEYTEGQVLEELRTLIGREKVKRKRLEGIN